MTTPASRRKKPLKHLRASDIRGIAQLASQATMGVTRIAEGVHQAVWDTLGVPGGNAPGQARGVTGLVYKSVHDLTQLLGKGVDSVLAGLLPLLESAADAEPEMPQREAVLAALLGTPHHGAPLERAGNWVDVILGETPYTAPFAKLGQLRSAGITDLRYGHVLDEDWHGHDRFRRRPDNRQVVPLPEGVACYTVAANTAAKRSALANRLIGDGLVPLHSALGQHDDPRRNLAFAKPSQWIAYRTNHLALLSSPEVARQIVQWLTPAQA